MDNQNDKCVYFFPFLNFLLPVLILFDSSFPVESFTQEVDGDEFIRIPPKSPVEELGHLHIKEGFRLELVAAEPLIEDPVAICFDENGKLFVAELHDHQHLPDPRTSKVKMLTDEDGDGRYDKAVTLASGLGWITAICPWDGGVFIGTSPDLVYLKDTTGDGRADVKRTIFSGFDHDEKGQISKNYHHERSLNNFNWGPGNRFFCAGGMNGGFVRNLLHPEMPPMVLKNLDFSFDPKNLKARAETGSSQHGMAIDDWGNRYQTKNSDPVLYPAYDLRYRLRNPGAAFPRPLASIARPDPKGPVFRRSSTEPWREARTRLRASGLEKGPIEKGGTASGYFTGTADSAIYRGTTFPEKYRGSLFVGEVSENVVHHREIHFPADRVEPDALRPKDEPDYEFIASSDNWFRPVQIINGPGAALYITDMYREVVEAWHTIPEYIREHLDRDSGKDRGRIWRLVPDRKSSPAVSSIALGGSNTAALVAALDSPDGWTCDTASRLIYQRQDSDAVPILEKMLTGNPVPNPRTTLGILYALDGLGALKASHVVPFLESPEPWLRIHSLRLLEQLKNEGANVPLMVFSEMTGDSNIRVLYQLAFSLGSFSGADISDSLYEIAKKFPEDQWLAAAIASSAGKEGLPGILDHLEKSKNQNTAMAIAIYREAGRLRVSLPAGYTELNNDPTDWIAPTLAYAQGLKSAKSSIAKTLGKQTAIELKSRCLEALADQSKSVKIRGKCLELLPLTGIKESELLSALLPLMKSGIPGDLQSAAIKSFQSGATSKNAGQLLTDFFPKSEAHLRPALIHLLTRRSVWCEVLLESIRDGAVKAMEIPAADAAYLRKHSSSSIAAAAGKLFPIPLDRGKVVTQFQRSLTLKGSAFSGEKIYRERCLVCHRLGKEGGQVGPAMGEYQKHGKGQILLNLLDPNKTVQPDYIGYLLTTNNGEIIMGRVLEDNGAGVKMRDAAGNDHDIPRNRIKSLTSTSRSLMPEGIESGLKEQDVADLLEFIAAVKE